MDYKTEYEKLRNLINEELDKSINVGYPEKIFESMKYSLNAGGKRLRPIMLLEASRVVSGDYKAAIPAACAFEMLHTQSLIHDDLPCMDNDDYRRGKLTNHKVFGEATAVLAGDALLSYAPAFIIDNSKDLPKDVQIKVLREFFKAAGVEGIIAGQVADLESEGKEPDFDMIKYIHEYKTAALFEAAIRAGAIIGGADDELLDKFTKFARAFGHAFQICDDIIDETATLEELGKTPGKDAKEGKMTYNALMGRENAIERFNELCAEIYEMTKGFESVIFKGITDDMNGKVNK